MTKIFQPLTLRDMPVQAEDIPLDKWELFFPEWILRRRAQFMESIQIQTAILQMLADDIGLGAPGIQVLRGLAEKPDIKMLRRWFGAQKIGAVVDQVTTDFASEAPPYAKIILYCVHKHVVHDLRHRLRAFGAVSTFADSPPNKRAVVLKKFGTQRGTKVLVCTVSAAPHIPQAIAAEAIFVEMEWSAGDNATAILRLHNAAQEKNVRVRFAQLEGTVDERITKVLRNNARKLVAEFDPTLPPKISDD